MTIPLTTWSLSCRAQMPLLSWRRDSGLHSRGCSIATVPQVWRSGFMLPRITFAQGTSNRKLWRKPGNGWASLGRPWGNLALTFRTCFA